MLCVSVRRQIQTREQSASLRGVCYHFESEPGPTAGLYASRASRVRVLSMRNIYVLVDSLITYGDNLRPTCAGVGTPLFTIAR